jgi:hypothetical protein
MQTVICLSKEDIKTFMMGLNFAIQPTPELMISFTFEAIEELIADYQKLKEARAPEASHGP